MRALRVIKQVEPAGTIRLENLPLREGETVEIIVLPINGEMNDLLKLSESSLGFWDNEIDDRVWNDALRPT
jgi:predicted DNA-binding antitoxin AbrB/MazE fold protein